MSRAGVGPGPLGRLAAMGAAVLVLAAPMPARAGYPAVIDCPDGADGRAHVTLYDDLTSLPIAGPLPVCALVRTGDRGELDCPVGAGPCVLFPGTSEGAEGPFDGVDLSVDAGQGEGTQLQSGCTLAVCLNQPLECISSDSCPLGLEGELGPCLEGEEQWVCAEPVEANTQLGRPDDVILPPLCTVAFDLRCDGVIDGADMEALREAARDGGVTPDDGGVDGEGPGGVTLTGGGTLSCECTASSVTASRRAAGLAVSALALLVAVPLRALRRGAWDRTARRRAPHHASVSR